jgi:hypothetical protein
MMFFLQLGKLVGILGLFVWWGIAVWNLIRLCRSRPVGTTWYRATNVMLVLLLPGEFQGARKKYRKQLIIGMFGFFGCFFLVALSGMAIGILRS